MSELSAMLIEIGNEVKRASKLHPKFHSAHEGFAVLLEEVEELKDEVWKNPKRRDLALMSAEAKQVAAMAVRFLMDVCMEKKT
jgi:hypothetical protein